MRAALNVPDHISNKNSIAWIQEVADLCQPDRVYWCDGSDAEYDRLCAAMVIRRKVARFASLPPRERPAFHDRTIKGQKPRKAAKASLTVPAKAEDKFLSHGPHKSAAN